MSKNFLLCLVLLTCFYQPFLLSAQAPANDQCAGGINIPDITSPTVINFNNLQADYSSNGSCEGTVGIVNNPDVWYNFVMPFNGNIKLTETSNSTIFVLYQGTCNGIQSGSSAGCDAGNNLVLQNLIAGITYQLKVGSNIASAGAKSFTIQAFGAANNNTCATANVNSANLITLRTFNFDNRGATESINASCESGADDNLDLWYKITMPVKGNIVISDADDAVSFSFYEACNEIAISCKKGNNIAYNLEANQQYILRVGTRKQSSGAYSFDIQALAQSAYDECVTAKSISNTQITNGIEIALDTRRASESQNTSCETTNDDNLDEWVSFTMPFDGRIDISGAALLNSFTLFEDCGGAEMSCKKGNQTISNLATGTTYKLRVAGTDINAAPFTFTLKAFEGPINDKCANSTTLTGDAGAGIEFNFDNTNAGASGVADCHPTDLDLWYNFTMPFDGSIQINGNSNLNYGVFENCNETAIQCTNTSSKIIDGLVGGTTYKIKIGSSIEQAGTDLITLKAIVNVPNDSCHTALPIDGNLTNPIQITLDPRSASNASFPSCQATTVKTNDVYYSFAMPFDGNIRFSNIPIFSVFFSLQTVCGGTEKGCEQVFGGGGNHFSAPLSGGETYILRVATIEIFSTEFTFTMQAFPHQPQDSCPGALNIPLPLNCDGPTVMVETRGAPAIASPTGCSSTGNVQGSWFSFQVNMEQSVNITSNSDTNYFALYSECGGQPIECITKEGAFDSLEWGKIYYLYAFREVKKSGAFSFCLQGVNAEVATPLGISCINSVPLPVSSAKQNNNQWVPILTPFGKIIAAIHANGNNLGSVTASVKKAATDIRTYGISNIPYLRREITINTLLKPTDAVRVRLFFTKSEFDDLVAAGGAPSGLTGMGSYKQENVSCTNGYDGTGNFIAANGDIYNLQDYYIQFNVNTFSTFFPGVSTNILPVKLKSFEAIQEGKSNIISWATEQELNSSHFNIERSENGNDWKTLFTLQAAVNSNLIKQYRYVDDLPLQELFYRLKMVDKDGTFAYSKILTVKRNNTEERLVVYPNPAKGNIRVQAKTGTYYIKLVGSDGRVLRSWSGIHLNNTGTQLPIQGLAPGLYRLQVSEVNNTSAVQWKNILIQ